MNITKHIPNTLTLCNLLLGCCGIVFAFHNELYFSGLAIVIAAVIDFGDGFVARLLKAQSTIGEQLDSLADMVTFGVLPGIIYFQLLASAWSAQETGLNAQMIFMLPALAIPACAALRLAKFNIDENQKTGFIGMPSPAQAIFAAMLPLIIFTNAFHLQTVLQNRWVLYGFILLFSYLMVSPIPMFALKMKSYGWKGNEARYVFLVFALAFIFLFKYTGLAFTILLYAAFSFLMWVAAKNKTVEPAPSENQTSK